jgi:arylsulfatase A-like enzyme
MKKTLLTVVTTFLLLAGLLAQKQDKPNILVIWGDDIGWANVSKYNHGIMGYQTPNIDKLGDEGAMFTDWYAQQSCTAGRAAFVTGQHPFRTGLLTIGMPGSPHGISEEMPTIADLLKPHGYMSGQFGKNHLGDRDEHLPTNHGFDEFFGNLYHLNAEEEPETYYYPKDPEFKKKYGPRGVIHSFADGKIEDTGPLTQKRMETVDEEFLAAALNFIERAHEQGKPFFVWFSATRMHVWTRLKDESEGVTGIGLYPDGMVEHDGHVGQLLAKLDELGITDNTMVMYSTDNGAETFTWPDGGITPFHGEKGTTWEGGFRVPSLIRWPGVIKPGTIYNDIFSHEDMLPTILAAAGDPNIKEKLLDGHDTGDKNFKVHIDGYNLMPYFQGVKSKKVRAKVFSILTRAAT